MASPTTTFRLSPNDRRLLDRLADELVCRRTDVVRYGMVALRDDPDRRRQIKAENLARTFLQSLRVHYGENAVLELVDGDPQREENWRLAGAPLDATVGVAATQQGDRWVLDLVDKVNGVAIQNVLSWTDEDHRRHAVVSLRDLWVYASAGQPGEPQVRQLIDGRTVVQIAEDDGTLRHLVIDDQGNSVRLKGSEVPAATLEVPPSIGIGVRRESEFGPHLGRGVGGQWPLTGDLSVDRKAIIDTLEKLLTKARAGELDDLIQIHERGAPLKA